MKENKTNSKRFLLVLILFELVSLHLLAYQFSNENKAQIIENKAKPKGTQEILLIKEMTIGDKEEAGIVFGNIGGISVSADGRIFILDTKLKKVKVFDSSGKLLKEFGQEGQGPGEWVLPAGIQVVDDRILIISDVGSRKLLYMDFEGNFLKEVSYGKKPFTKVVELGDCLLATEITMAGTSLDYNIGLYDKNLDQIVKIDSLSVPLPLAGTKVNPFEAIYDYCFNEKGNIVFGKGVKYEIKFFTRAGDLIKIIRKEYKPQSINENDKLEILRMIPETTGLNIRELIYFPNNFPAFSSFFFDEKGYLYVRTFQKGKLFGSYIVDIFSPEGIYVASCEMPGNSHVWKSGKLYAVEKDLEDNQYVCRYDSKWLKRD